MREKEKREMGDERSMPCESRAMVLNWEQFFLGRYLAMVVTTWERGHYWYLVGRGRGSC